MCLVVKKDTEFEIAKEDILVYKKMEPVKKFFGLITHWVTPYLMIDIGRIRRGKTFEAEGFAVKKPFDEKRDMVEEGVIHVFARKSDCLKSWWLGKTFECIIPKGSEYIKGNISGTMAKSYGAKKIVFVKRIK